TGHHETTRMCLAALQETGTPGAEVLDVGVGSGVLAIAAVKLGAARVDGVDVDAIAIEVAEENCRENGVDEQVRLTKGTLEEDHGRQYDVVVANISRQANVALAPAFAKAVRPGGSLILSGVLQTDVPIVTSAMQAAGFVETGMEQEGEWALLTYRPA